METNCSLRRAALFSKSSSGSQSAFASADRLREAGLAVFQAVERVAALGLVIGSNLAQAARHSTYAHVTVRQGQAVSDIIDLNRAVPENA